MVLLENADPDNCSYSRHGISFNTHGTFSLSDRGWVAKNVIIFVADNSSLAHIENRKKGIVILGKVSFQRKGLPKLLWMHMLNSLSNLANKIKKIA